MQNSFSSTIDTHIFIFFVVTFNAFSHLNILNAPLFRISTIDHIKIERKKKMLLFDFKAIIFEDRFLYISTQIFFFIFVALCVCGDVVFVVVDR